MVQAKRLSRAESKAQTREALLEAAASVLAQRGWRAATLDAVAEAAGLTKGAVYSNFASKEDLFFALADERVAGMMRSLTQALGATRTAQDKLSALGAWFASVVDETRDWILLSTEFALSAARDPRLGEKLAARYAEERASIADVIEQQCAELRIDPPLPPAQLAAAVLALGEGLGMQRLIEGAAVGEDIFPSAVSLLLGLPHEAGRAQRLAREADQLLRDERRA